MKKKILKFFLVSLLILILGITIKLHNDDHFFISNNSQISLMLNKELEMDKKPAEEKEIAPLFFNFLSRIIYKFAQ